MLVKSSGEIEAPHLSWAIVVWWRDFMKEVQGAGSKKKS